MASLHLLERLRRFVRDSLPPSLGLCFTLRANPLLGLAFLVLRREFRIEGMRFTVPLAHQSWSSLATYWFDDYEKPEREFCSEFIQAEDTVCELGGCLGIVSMVINRRLQNPSRHLVVEANPALIPWIHTNRDRNGGGFHILHAAAGNGEALRFNGATGMLTGREADEPSEGVLVEGKSLSELWQSFGPFTVLVMDIEGAERSVFTGRDEHWKDCHLIVVEWHPSLITEAAVAECRDRLVSAGFRCVGTRSGSLHVVEAWRRGGAE